MVKISVLIPVYNVGPYLKRCLDSVIGQTYTNLEIICIDDGSTDDSGRILDDYADQDGRIKIVHKKNTGYGHSMNLGLALATGDYIGIVESDDHITADMYEKLIKVIEEGKEDLDIVKASYYECTQYGEKRKKNLDAKKCGHVIAPEEYIELFWFGCSLWSGIYRREFLKRNDIKFLETPGASYQDASFYFKVLAVAEKIYLLDDAVVFYQTDNENSSVNTSGKIFCVCDEMKEIERYMDQHNLHSSFLEAIKNAYIYRTYIWNYYRLHAGLRSAFWGELVRKVREIAESHYLKREYWNDWNWNNFQSILDHPEKFFWETNYELKMLGIDQYTIKNKIYKDVLVDCLKKQERIIIYGAGVYGKRVFDFLASLGMAKNVFCFAVTNEEKSGRNFGGIPIYVIKELLQWTKEALIIVAVAERRQQDILKLLKGLKFEAVIRVDKEFMELMNRKEDVVK